MHFVINGIRPILGTTIFLCNFRGAELTWQGRPIKPTQDTMHIMITSVECEGEELTLEDCVLRRDTHNHTCSIGRDAVAVRQVF